MNKIRAFLLGLLLLVSCPASASFFGEYFIDPEDGMLDASKFLSETPYGFLPVPTVITDPAVGTGLGVMAIFFHESEEQKKQRATKGLLPTNISLVGLAGTDNGTRAGLIGHLGFWRQDTLRYKGFVLYPSVNMDFYSLGGVTLPTPVGLNIEGPAVIQSLLQRMGKSNWFIGMRQVYSNVETTFNNDGDFSTVDFPPLNEYVVNNTRSGIATSGIGIELEYNSLKNPFNPRNGYDYSLQYMVFDEAIGSDVDYTTYTATALNYWDLTPKLNLALRLQYDGLDADNALRLPPYVPPSIDLRGIPTNRYQGSDVAVAEISVGWQFNQRWLGHVFTGTGRAADSFSDLSSARSESTIGTGFRYLVAKRYGLIMGIDVAWGPEDTAVYIQAGADWR